LNAAVEASEEVIKSTPCKHPNRPACLSNLGIALQSRFEQTGSMDDLNAVVEVIDEAVKATPHDHPNRMIYLNNLVNALQSEFE
jgi:hypothetical protein